MPQFVPGVGFQGYAQMTPAVRAAYTGGKGLGSTGPRRKRRKAKKTRSKKTRSKKRSGSKLKFGSPAWQKKYKTGKFAKKRR